MDVTKTIRPVGFQGNRIMNPCFVILSDKHQNQAQINAVSFTGGSAPFHGDSYMNAVVAIPLEERLASVPFPTVIRTQHQHIAVERERFLEGYRLGFYAPVPDDGTPIKPLKFDSTHSVDGSFMLGFAQGLCTRSSCRECRLQPEWQHLIKAFQQFQETSNSGVWLQALEDFRRAQ